MTPAGRAAAVAGAVLVPAGWVLGYPALVVLGAGFALALLLGLALVRTAPTLVLERELVSHRVVEGDEVHAVLRAENPGPRPVGAVTVLDPRRRGGVTEVTEIGLGALGGQSEARVPYATPPLRRGRYDLGPLGVSRSDPFGLVRAVRTSGGEEMLWVHPRTAAVSPLPSGRTRDLDGPTSARAARGGVSFHTLREYIPGDDLRQIHWASTARTGTIMVREHVDTDHPRTTVVLDLARHTYRDDDAFDEAVRIAASVVVASTRYQFPVRLLTSDGTTLGGHGEPATDFLDRLASVDRLDAVPVAGAIEVGPGAPGGSSLVLVCGDVGPAELGVLGAARLRFELVTVIRVTALGMLGASPSGVAVLTVTNLREFVAAWNQVVVR